MTHNPNVSRRTLLGAALALSINAPHALAQNKQLLRISTPAVPDDWHARMWNVLKEQLDQTAPGQFDVQINLNASLFKQGAEPVAMARGNLEMASISAFDIAKIVPEFSIFTAGYVIRDPAHLMKVFNGPIGADLFKRVGEKTHPFDRNAVALRIAGVLVGTEQLGNKVGFLAASVLGS